MSFDVAFVTHDGGTHILRKEIPNASLYGTITVGNNVFIGARAIIMPNVKIGNNCIIGAGSIVTKDVEDGTIVAGISLFKNVADFDDDDSPEVSTDSMRK